MRGGDNERVIILCWSGLQNFGSVITVENDFGLSVNNLKLFFNGNVRLFIS